VRTSLPPFAARNPLTRSLGRRLWHADWSATLSEIDFPYSIEDDTVAGVACARYRAAAASAPSIATILYVHAGAFIAGSARINAATALPVCMLGPCDGIGVDYALAPEAAFPTQLDQIERVYLELQRAGRPILLLGDSAGGALVLSSLHRWRRKGFPLPAGAVLISPLTDARAASDTHCTLKDQDPFFGSAGAEGVPIVFDLYAGGCDIDDPEISPIASDFVGFPPLSVHVGSREVLLGDSARLVEKARRAGCDATLSVIDGMFHLFHMRWSLAEAKAVHTDIAAFVRRVAAGK
jgi:acetyl esterase/lipase